MDFLELRNQLRQDIEQLRVEVAKVSYIFSNLWLLFSYKLLQDIQSNTVSRSALKRDAEQLVFRASC